MNRIALLLAPLVCLAAVEDYSEDFSAATAVPDTIMVLNGEFAVTEAGGNKLLEVAPTPLETFSSLFGPTGKSGLAVRGRAKGESKGRKYPVFGYGLGGVTGNVLQLSGAKRALVLMRGETEVASVPFEFPSDKWVWFNLQVRPDGAAFVVEGKAWLDGQEEPKAWLITVPLDKEPVAGRASCWAIPYAGKPISFDDFSVTKAR